MEAILYKDNVYIDDEKLNFTLDNIMDKVVNNRSKLMWDITNLENQLKYLKDKKEKLDKVSED